VLIHRLFFTPLSAVPSQPPPVSPRSRNQYSWPYIDLSPQRQCPTAGNPTSRGGDCQEWLPFCTELRWTEHSQFINCKLTPLHCSICYSLPLPNPPLVNLRLTSSSTVTTQRDAQARIRGSAPVRCTRLFSPLECLHRLWDATRRLFNEYSQVILRGSSGWGVSGKPDSPSTGEVERVHMPRQGVQDETFIDRF